MGPPGHAPPPARRPQGLAEAPGPPVVRADQLLQLVALKLPMLLEHPADEVDLAVEVFPGHRSQAARGACGSDHAGRIERTADTRLDAMHAPALPAQRLAAPIADPLLALRLGEHDVLLLKGRRSRPVLGRIDALLGGQ